MPEPRSLGASSGVAVRAPHYTGPSTYPIPADTPTPMSFRGPARLKMRLKRESWTCPRACVPLPFFSLSTELGVGICALAHMPTPILISPSPLKALRRRRSAFGGRGDKGGEGSLGWGGGVLPRTHAPPISPAPPCALHTSPARLCAGPGSPRPHTTPPPDPSAPCITHRPPAGYRRTPLRLPPP